MNLETTYLAGDVIGDLKDSLDKLKVYKKQLCWFSGGHIDDVSYQDVSSGQTGHAETIMIKFDQDQLSFENLLLEFFKFHNPTTPNQQGNDIGSQYRSSIFYTSE